MKALKDFYYYVRFGKVSSVVKDKINDIPCEIAYYDRNGRMIGYWAYGYFDPNMPYKPGE